MPGAFLDRAKLGIITISCGFATITFFAVFVIIGCTYHIHVYAVRVGPCVLEVFLQPLSQRVWDLMKPDELFHFLHLRVVTRRARVEALYNGAHITEDAGVHQG